ncbi:MAG: DEAD/DEAH box helicase [Patescibacteria group bacterium UBA2163]
MNTNNNRQRRGAPYSSQKRKPFHSSSRSGGGSRGPSRGPARGGFRGGARGGARGGRKMPTFNPANFINTNPKKVVQEEYVPEHSFENIGINKKFADHIVKLGMTKPTPIQDQIIPTILKGQDVIGLAETGTGKTAAFLIPLIEKALKDQNRQTLIIAPTRELAVQIRDELQKLSSCFRIFSAMCVGGVDIRPQLRAVSRPNDFVIGTPGRILDLIKRGALKPQYITTVVLDEADRMLDMGFITDIKKIISEIPKERETLFFSATFDVKTKKLTDDFLKDPVTVSVKKNDITQSIEQDVVHYLQADKFGTLTNLLKDPELKRVLIFGAMKHSVQKIAQQLSDSGISATAIHGNKTHGQRQNALSRFKSGEARVLVATDVAARGIHVEQVSHVINYDLPGTFEDYVHRIGRTGRGDKQGKALTFVPKR